MPLAMMERRAVALQIKGELLLASESPRRAELLKFMGLDFEVMPGGVEERLIDGEGPRQHVLRLAEQKAQAVAMLRPEAWVLGADTVVVMDGEILGKPADLSQANAMLKKLSGKEHLVYTGFALARRSAGFLAGDAVISAVRFKDLSAAEIQWYVRTGEPYDKAGGYGAQGAGAFFIKEIRGSHTNVIGLPLCEVIGLLQRAGALEFSGE